MQSSAIIVQGLANSTLTGSLWLRLGKELILSLLNGLVLGLILLVGSYFLLNVDYMVGITVTISLIAVILIASIIGTAIPYFSIAKIILGF